MNTLIVSLGKRLWIIGYAVIATAATNQFAEASVPSISQSISAPAVHIVKKGDTLYGLSKKYGVSVSSLRSANGIHGDVIRIGQKIKIPSGGGNKLTFHIVQRGDSLSGIGSRYEVTVSQIMEWNSLRKTTIYPGQKLRVSKAVVSVPSKSKPQAVPLKKVDSTQDGLSDRIDPPEVPVADFPKLKFPAQGERDGDPKKRKTRVELELLPHDDRLRVQIYLDQSGFRPGKLDGSIGEFTNKAANRWKEARGLQEEGIDTLVHEAKRKIQNPYRVYVISSADVNQVGRLASTIPHKAHQSRLPYASVAEVVAEKFHTDHRMLERLNPGVSLYSLSKGNKVSVPNVADTFSFPGDVPKGGMGTTQNRIIIVWPEEILEVRDSNGKILASFPVTLGAQASHVRSGDWRVANVTPHPSFRWDASVLKEGRRSSSYYILPPGPNNLVGVMWLGLKRPDGSLSHVGIHGTDHPETIGRAHSSGCIRLANWDVVKLAGLVNVGCAVNWRRH